MQIFIFMQFINFFNVLDCESECLHSTAITHLYLLLEFLWFNFFNLNLYSFGVYPGMRCKLWIQSKFSPDDYPVVPISFIELFIFSLLVGDVTFIIPKIPLELGSLSGFSILQVCVLMHQDHTVFNYLGSRFS